MKFRFSARNLDPKDYLLQRMFEVMPGGTSWGILLGMSVLSFWKPIWAAILIIAFDFFWILRLFYMTVFLVISYIRLAAEKETDWMQRIANLRRVRDYLVELETQPDLKKKSSKLSRWIHSREVRELVKCGMVPPADRSIVHLVLIPIIREPKQVLIDGLQSFIRGHFPASQILPVVALEERATEEVKKGVREVEAQFKKSFYDFKVILHPADLPGEARVKGANITFAARHMTRYFEEKKIPHENIVVSCFDADTVISPEYFSCLTYQYLVSPDRDRASFQPIPVYHNNIWKVPGFARVLETGSSFFQLVESTDPEKMVTFSSHSMSFKALVEVDYWPVDMISDDSAIFWKSLIHYDGRYRTIPLFVTVSMDVVDAGTWWGTISSVYRQKRRWAWGVENFPIVMRAFLKSKEISWVRKFKLSMKLFEMHVSWATWAFLLSIISWFPALSTQQGFAQTVLYYSAPRVTALIFGLSTAALAISVLLSISLLPKKEGKESLLKKLMHAAEWCLIPGIFTFLSTCPALEAQTRLLLGKPMEKWGTDRVVKS